METEKTAHNGVPRRKFENRAAALPCLEYADLPCFRIGRLAGKVWVQHYLLTLFLNENRWEEVQNPYCRLTTHFGFRQFIVWPIANFFL